jgi:hypothetical protein
MIIFKIIMFIIAIILLIKAILNEDFNSLFIAILLFVISLGLKKI